MTEDDIMTIGTMRATMEATLRIVERQKEANEKLCARNFELEAEKAAAAAVGSVQRMDSFLRYLSEVLATGERLAMPADPANLRRTIATLIRKHFGEERAERFATR